LRISWAEGISDVFLTLFGDVSNLLSSNLIRCERIGCESILLDKLLFVLWLNDGNLSTGILSSELFEKERDKRRLKWYEKN
jgi:hypothetical protein